MSRKLHELEMRPFRDTRVHATAFQRAVETVANFDEVSQEEAATRIIADLDAGKMRLLVEQGFAAYQIVRSA